MTRISTRSGAPRVPELSRSAELGAPVRPVRFGNHVVEAADEAQRTVLAVDVAILEPDVPPPGIEPSIRELDVPRRHVHHLRADVRADDVFPIGPVRDERVPDAR